MTVNDFQPEQTAIEPEGERDRFIFKAAGGGALVLLGGAAAWGLIAYYFDSIYLAIAVVIGMAAAFTVMIQVKNPSKLITVLLIFPSVVVTLLTVLVGEIEFFILYVINEYGFSIGEALTALQYNFGEFISEESTVDSLFYGLMGGVIGYFFVVRSK